MFCFRKNKTIKIRSLQIKPHKIELFPELQLEFKVESFSYLASNKHSL